MSYLSGSGCYPLAAVAAPIVEDRGREFSPMTSLRCGALVAVIGMKLLTFPIAG